MGGNALDYNHSQIGKKRQGYWDENKTFKTNDNLGQKKFYVLDMFPYPSSAGLHVGHPEGYTATDIISKYKRMQGYNILHPMGRDTFGLPVEQYALDTGNNPRKFTKKNIQTSKRQIKELGFSYDWDREVNTTDPEYYKWTQWTFIQLYNKDLAYADEATVSWCPALGTVLSNEEVIDGVSEHGGYSVYRKPMKQWVLKITEYAGQLLAGLDDLDWPESLKDMQRNWIGRSEGTRVSFDVDNSEGKVEVFTTRPDTIYGASFLVLSPEHALVGSIITDEYKDQVKVYQTETSKKSGLERTDLAKDKSGVFTGAYAINPLSGEKVQIWIADHVLSIYGTSAIMAIPTHDNRDYEFTKKLDLPIVGVTEGGNIKEAAYTGEGKHINPGELDGLENEAATIKAIQLLGKKGADEKKVNHKLRDWLFSR